MSVVLVVFFVVMSSTKVSGSCLRVLLLYLQNVACSWQDYGSDSFADYGWCFARVLAVGLRINLRPIFTRVDIEICRCASCKCSMSLRMPSSPSQTCVSRHSLSLKVGTLIPRMFCVSWHHLPCKSTLHPNSVHCKDMKLRPHFPQGVPECFPNT